MQCMQNLKKIIKNSPSHTKATLQGEPKLRTQMESFQIQDELCTEISSRKFRIRQIIPSTKKSPKVWSFQENLLSLQRFNQESKYYGKEQ